MAETWKDRLVDARLSPEEATEFERLVITEGSDPDEALNLIKLKRHHDQLTGGHNDAG